MRRMNGLRLAAILFGVSAAASGCRKQGCERITGQVTLDGKPLTQATVWFWPKSDLKLGSAAVVTDDKGAFDLEPNKPGCWLKPGQYTVLVVKFVNKKGEVVFPEN